MIRYSNEQIIPLPPCRISKPCSLASRKWRDSKNLTCPESRLINSLIGARGSALPLSARLAGLVGKGGTCRPRVGKRISVGATLSGRLQGRKTERGGTGCFAAAAAAGLRCLLFCLLLLLAFLPPRRLLQRARTVDNPGRKIKEREPLGVVTASPFARGDISFDRSG